MWIQSTRLVLRERGRWFVYLFALKYREATQTGWLGRLPVVLGSSKKIPMPQRHESVCVLAFEHFSNLLIKPAHGVYVERTAGRTKGGINHRLKINREWRATSGGGSKIRRLSHRCSVSLLNKSSLSLSLSRLTWRREREVDGLLLRRHS